MFTDRKEAGEKLAQKLIKYRKKNISILAIPRGGVVVAKEVAKVLNAPFSVLIVRKLSSPYNKEFAIGAIAENDVNILDHDMITRLGLTKERINSLQKREFYELERRRVLYRKRHLPSLKNQTVILVDDGLATGLTAQAAILSVKKLHPQEIVLAVPVCSTEAFEEARKFVDKIVCLEISDTFRSIGQMYEEFPQIEDREVIEIMERFEKNIKKLQQAFRMF